MSLLLLFPSSAPAAVTGTGAVAFVVSATASTGVETFAGTGAEIFAGPALAGDGLVIAHIGTAAEAFSGPALAAVGAETFTGAGTVVVSGAGLVGSGLETFTGTGAVAVAGPGLAGDGLQGQSGTASIAFAGPATAGTGAETFDGTGAVAFAFALVGTGAETLTGTGDVAFQGPALFGVEDSSVAGTGDVAFQGPALAGVGIGAAEEPLQQIVGPPRRRYVPAPLPQAITGHGGVAFAAPAIRGQGQAAATFGVGAAAIAGPTLEADGTVTAVGVGVTATNAADLSGRGTVRSRRVVKSKALHPARSIHGVGVMSASTPLLTTCGQIVQSTDEIDAAWRMLQEDREDEEHVLLFLLGRLDA